MEQGLAPNQPFRVTAEVSYRTVWPEHETDIDWEIVEKSYVEPLDAAARWQEWLHAVKPCNDPWHDAQALTGVPGTRCPTCGR